MKFQIILDIDPFSTGHHDYGRTRVLNMGDIPNATALPRIPVLEPFVPFGRAVRRSMKPWFAKCSMGRTVYLPTWRVWLLWFSCRQNIPKNMEHRGLQMINWKDKNPTAGAVDCWYQNLYASGIESINPMSWYPTKALKSQRTSLVANQHFHPETLTKTV